MTTTLSAGDHCFITKYDAITGRRVVDSFPGKVLDTNKNWIRVTGPGSEEGVFFDEWFPIKAKRIDVRPGSILQIRS